MALTGSEIVTVIGIDQKNGQACIVEQTTTQAIANLSGGGGLVPANPTAVAKDTAVNGSATTYMRSDAAPAVQKGTAAQFGIVQVDGTTITSTGGVITAAVPTGTNPTATAGPTAINGTSNTFMRSDAAPAIQLGSAAQFGLVKVDNLTITASGGVISATPGSAANPTATASDVAVNGSAVTYMRSDAAPAVQKGSNAQFGLVKGDGTTISVTGGVATVVGSPPSSIGLTNSHILVGNVSNVATDVAVSGDISLANTGVMTLNSNQKIVDLTFVINGAGAAITTGIKGYIFIDFNCTINQATLLADRTGSIVVDIWECSYAQFDAGATHPVAGDKITGSTPPTITTATKAQDSTLSGWTTVISAGSVLGFNVNSASTIQQVTLALKVTKS